MKEGFSLTLGLASGMSACQPVRSLPLKREMAFGFLAVVFGFSLVGSLAKRDADKAKSKILVFITL